MLPDLIRAVPAALLVALVPGWFWARLLRAPADTYERAAYATALSITLVPTAALALARLTGTGVTLSVTLISVALVFLAGLGAYLFSGPVKGSDEPLVPIPAPPGLSTLVPLIAAFALASAALSGLARGWWIGPLVALLVFSGSVVYVLASPRPGAAREAADLREPSFPPAARHVVLPAVLLLVLLRGYLGPLLHGWPYPRGVDRYEHAVMSGMMMNEGTTESFMLYPPGFHLLTAMICRISGLEPLEVFPALAPALLLLPALGCYALASRLWGWEVGAAAALLSGVILGGTYLHFSEARYPNFIGTYFLLAVAVAALVGVYASPSVRSGLLLAVAGSSAVLYHQIASYILAVLLAVAGVLFLPYLLLRDRRRGLALFGSLVLLGLLSVVYAWDTYDLPRLLTGLLGSSEATGRGGEAVAMAIGTKPAYDLGHLLMTTSQPVLWLGLLGAMLAGGELLRRRVGMVQTLAYLTLLIWTLLLFAGSRTPLSGFPDRFERDLGIPLAILAALALVAVLRSLNARSGPVAVLAVLLTALLVGTQAVQNLQQAAGPSPRLKDRPAPPQVVAAGRWLEQHSNGGNIIATPYLAYVPSRGMLAMGDYTGMQSYDAPRIRRARDLPPFGAGPLWDALWVLQHPEGARTRRILENNNVRYVVFHKRYPTIDWRAFERQDELYRVAFENESVIIFEPRKTPAAASVQSEASLGAPDAGSSPNSGLQISASRARQ